MLRIEPGMQIHTHARVHDGFSPLLERAIGVRLGPMVSKLRVFRHLSSVRLARSPPQPL